MNKAIDIVRQAMQDRNMSMTALASKMGSYPSLISNFIRGFSCLSYSNAQKIEKILDVSICDILHDIKDLRPPKTRVPLPSWVKASPAEIRPLIEQEYYVDPERAFYFYQNAKTKEDIYRLRSELRDGLLKHSNTGVNANFRSLR